MAYGFNDKKEKVEVYPTSETYNKSEVYNKDEVFSKAESAQYNDVQYQEFSYVDFEVNSGETISIPIDFNTIVDSGKQFLSLLGLCVYTKNIPSQSYSIDTTEKIKITLDVSQFLSGTMYLYNTTSMKLYVRVDFTTSALRKISTQNNNQ